MVLPHLSPIPLCHLLTLDLAGSQLSVEEEEGREGEGKEGGGRDD